MKTKFDLTKCAHCKKDLPEIKLPPGCIRRYCGLRCRQNFYGVITYIKSKYCVDVEALKSVINAKK